MNNLSPNDRNKLLNFLYEVRVEIVNLEQKKQGKYYTK